MRAQTRTANLHNVPSTRPPAVNSKPIIHPLSQNIYVNVSQHNHQAISAMRPAYNTATATTTHASISVDMSHVEKKNNAEPLQMNGFPGRKK